MTLRLKALRSLRWNYRANQLWGLFFEAECDCWQCDGCFPVFDHHFEPPREIPCPSCKGRGTEPCGERNLTQLLLDPAYFIARMEAKRRLSAQLAEGVFA